MNAKNPRDPRQRPDSVRRAQTGKKKARTPAWKVLVTIMLMVLSMAIVTVLVLTMVFHIPIFGGGGLKGMMTGIGDKFEPTVSPTGVTDADTGMPVLSGDRKKGVFNFLVVGLNDDTGNNTDTIMLAQYNVTDQKVNVVQIPRDTYINAGYNFHKINSVFASGYNSASASMTKAERRKEGMDELTAFIESNMTVKIDFYVLVDLGAFEGFIDSIGGLHVNVPCDMDYEDPEQNLFIHLRAGEQTLSGYDAMCMVRNRHTYADADYGRMNVQKIFMSALLKQLKGSMTDPATLSGIIKIAFNDVTTNLKLEDCIYFATRVINLDMANLTMLTLPTQSVSGVISVLEYNTVPVINEYLNVYDESVTADSFDPKNRLTNTRDKGLYDAYLHWDYPPDVYHANDVDENSIHLNVMH